MSKEKPLSDKQLVVIDDLFEGELQEREILKKHNLSRKLYEKWLADDTFNRRLDRRIEWENRLSEFMLARKARQAVSNLVKLTEPEKGETARKACIDIITMRAKSLAGTPATPVDNPASAVPQPLTQETAGKILAVLAEENEAS